jgi:tetratricopeptide (TPR) repeat protein
MKIDKLKAKAREHEQGEEWSEAMALYSQALERAEADGEPEIALYNRIGDLQVRMGDLQGAVENYETAIDLYLDADLANNALAVCRKLERNAPGRAAVRLRMGQIRARQGFVVDARRDFLEYAELQVAQADVEEALRALEEFSRLVPDDAETRVFLADLLVTLERSDEAVTHLQAAARYLQDAGDVEGAEQLRTRILELDPEADPEGGDAFPSPEAESRAEAGAGDSADSGLPGFETTALPGFEADAVSLPGDQSSVREDAPGLDHGVVQPVEDHESGRSPQADPLEGITFDLGEDASPDDDTSKVSDADGEDQDSQALVDSGPMDPETFADPGMVDSDALTDPDSREGPEFDLSEDGLTDADELPSGDTSGQEELPVLEDDKALDPLPTLDDPEPSLPSPSSAGPTESSLHHRAEEELTPETLLPDEGDAETVPASSVAETLNTLRERVTEDPSDAAGWRDLGSVLLEKGMDEEARIALTRAHRTYADNGDPEKAMRVVRDLIFQDPDEVAHYKRLVEYAHRTEDRALLVPAFLELAEALERTGAGRKAEVVYGQVLALDPRNPRAQRALASEPKDDAQEEFVDLGGMVLDEPGPRTFRWKVADAEPSGDEEADFARMLSQFKERVARDLPSDDVTARYDLGAAYKEMGLLDEAATEFQQVVRARPNHLGAFEMLGQCFLEKGQPEVSIRSLSRALDAGYQVEDELLGIYYYLAKAYEEVGNPKSAREFYERVFSLDINFKDVTERLRELR